MAPNSDKDVIKQHRTQIQGPATWDRHGETVNWCPRQLFAVNVFSFDQSWGARLATSSRRPQRLRRDSDVFLQADMGKPSHIVAPPRCQPHAPLPFSFLFIRFDSR